MLTQDVITIPKSSAMYDRKRCKQTEERNSRRTVFFSYMIYLICLGISDSFPEYLKAEVEAYPPKSPGWVDQIRSACVHLKIQLF